MIKKMLNDLLGRFIVQNENLNQKVMKKIEEYNKDEMVQLMRGILAAMEQMDASLNKLIEIETNNQELLVALTTNIEIMLNDDCCDCEEGIEPNEKCN